MASGSVVTLPTLQLGSTGPAVNELQRLLAKVGIFPTDALGRVDVNMVGPVTAQAVQKFQQQAGRPATGVADDATWTQLYVVAGEAKIVSGALTVAQGGAPLVAPTKPAVGPVGPAGPQKKSASTSASSGILPKLIVGLGVAGVAYYVYRRAARNAGGAVASLDDGEDNAGPAFRASRALSRLAGSTRAKKPVKRAKHESSEREGTITVPEPRQTWGRNAWRTMRDEETGDEITPIYPGDPPRVIRLEADEKMFKAQKQYREDMKSRAWDRARANDTTVHVVARGTARALYKADPRKQ